MLRAVIGVTVSASAVVAGVFSLGVARADAGYSFAGAGAGGAAALVGAGWALVACGLVFRFLRPGSRCGVLLMLAGFAWFLLEWNNPGVGSAPSFTTGLALFLLCPPLVAHAVLSYPGGRLGSLAERGAVAVGYGGAVFALGVLPALLFDPKANGCSQCPRNLLLLADRAETSADLSRAGVYLGLASALTLAAITVVKLARGSPAARRARWPVLGAGGVYLILVAALLAASLDRGFVANGTLERRLWLAQAAALVGITAGVAWSWMRARRARSAVARLVVDLAHAPPTGRLRDALARIVGDEQLIVAYPVGDAGGLVDVDGTPIDVPAGLARTTLVREGQPVAVLAHVPGRLDDDHLLDELTAASRLALENERLQAEVSARLEELRRSRARIVEAGDAERRRLERDLHDGAQQRLVGLALRLRLAQSQLAPGIDGNVVARLAEAQDELRSATAELRDVAHGIFPAVLADEGFAAAVEALAEDGRVHVRIGDLPDTRFPAPVETAAYTVVARAVSVARDRIAVQAWPANERLVVQVDTEQLDDLDVAELEDRVGALDGRLAVERRADGATIRAELPCAS